MNWFDCMLAFKTVADCESFIKAAKRLGITTSAITKRIQWLETKLKTTVFLRTTRKISLTEFGNFLLRRVNPILNEWEDLQNQLADYQIEPQGELSICMPPNFSGLSIFTKAFINFLQTYSKLNLRISSTNKPISLQDEGIDILIAPEKYLLDPQTTIGVKLFDYFYSYYAAPTYINKTKKLKSPKDITTHNCIIFRDDNKWKFNDKTYSVNGSFKVDSRDSLVALCILGKGIIRIPSFMIRQEIQQGLLKQVLPTYTSQEDQLKFFYTKYMYKPRKISAFIEFFQNYFKSISYNN